MSGKRNLISIKQKYAIDQWEKRQNSPKIAKPLCPSKSADNSKAEWQLQFRTGRKLAKCAGTTPAFSKPWPRGNCPAKGAHHRLANVLQQVLRRGHRRQCRTRRGSAKGALWPLSAARRPHCPSSSSQPLLSFALAPVERQVASKWFLLVRAAPAEFDKRNFAADSPEGRRHPLRLVDVVRELATSIFTAARKKQGRTPTSVGHGRNIRLFLAIHVEFCPPIAGQAEFLMQGEFRTGRWISVGPRCP